MPKQFRSTALFRRTALILCPQILLDLAQPSPQAIRRKPVVKSVSGFTIQLDCTRSNVLEIVLITDRAASGRNSERPARFFWSGKACVFCLVLRFGLGDLPCGRTGLGIKVVYLNENNQADLPINIDSTGSKRRRKHSPDHPESY